MTPQERLQQGVGVVGVRCAACGSTVLVVNAAEFARDLVTFGAAYYVCKACAAHPGLEHALQADGDGTELLLTPDCTG